MASTNNTRHMCRTCVISAFGLLPGALLASGCTQDQPTTQPSAIYDRQEQALKDPMNYSPDMQNTDMSDGDIGSYNPKTMKKDLDDLWNP